MRRLLLAALLLLASSARAEAGCSGSGLTWSCTAGTTPAEINRTLGRASDGATLTFAAGSYTWSANTARILPILTKGVTLICESVGACDVNFMGGRVWEFPAGSSSKFYRFSGFDFTTTGGSIWWWQCSGGGCPSSSYTNIRIDHNTFTLPGSNQLILFGEGPVRTKLAGLFDHNTIIESRHSANMMLFVASTPTVARTNSLGASDNFFIEDNIITATVATEGGVGCTDGWSDFGIVVRFNTITNCRVLAHSIDDAWGFDNFEIYGNSFTNNANAAFKDCYRSIHHQGSGTMMVWGNSATCSGGHSSEIAHVLHYRAFGPGPGPGRVSICDGTWAGNGFATDGNRSPTATYRGYPCFHQPGRGFDGLLRPMASWMNYWTSDNTQFNLVINNSGGSPNYTPEHVKLNRDLYQAVSRNAQTSPTSPFDGTTGMGYGTLANRPTSCTTTTESADAGRGGVMYWATDQGSWNSSASNPQGVNLAGADGVLYLCTATNTWSVYYTPYTYPHPLQASGGGSGGAPPKVQLRRGAELNALPFVASVVFFGAGRLRQRRGRA